jgi:transposase, IS5 family
MILHPSVCISPDANVLINIIGISIVGRITSFITADPGHARADKPRGDDARTRRSRDGAWGKKGDKSIFGYKLHMKMDLGHGLIRELEATAANVYDSWVDLSVPGEVVYRDYGVSGCETEGL